MKTIKRLISAVLAVLMLLTSCITSFAMSEDEWKSVWKSADSKAGIVMFPGSDETQRNFSWYTETENEPGVIISKRELMTDAKTFKGSTVKASEGDFANKVTVTGLEHNTTYYYQCVSGDFKSEVYSFKTADEADFSAMYVTDIHITEDAQDAESLSKTSYDFNQIFEAALDKNPDISIILSAGDQATEGLESEYKGLTASPLLKTVTLATAIGNHDRKGIEYKTYTNMPNEDTKSSVSTYIGEDYWFVKGDVLFLVMDTNNANGAAHASFIKRAVKANPDVKWKVMMAHHDLYSGRIPHRESENRLLRMLWGPIADQFGIDLVLLGHSHYYTVSNVIYSNETVAPFENSMTDIAGSIYMVSCSINRAREDEEIGLREDIGFDYLTQKATYNILDFSSDSITVSSYEDGSDEPFNSFTITKTSADGGHPEKQSIFTSIWNWIARRLGTVYALFVNIGVYSDLKEDGYDIGFFDCLFGN